VTVERGTAWGRPGPLPDDGVVVHDDRQARAIVEAHRRDNQPLPVLGLLGGDLARTLGSTGDEARLRSSSAMTFTVDVGAALIDGRLHWFVAHLIARRSWWRGRVVAVMNAQWLGRYDLGPRAHPGDGRVDVSDGDLTLSDRLKARKRLPLGTHVPHPDIATRSVTAWQTDFDPPLRVWLDGDDLGHARHLSVRVEPDALTVVV
jgi:hypothetical protein